MRGCPDPGAAGRSARLAWTAARAAVLCVGWLALDAQARAQAAAGLQYQARGDRTEGLRTIAVGGYDVELLSARVQPAGATLSAQAGWGELVHVRFFHPGDEKVFITVRQLRSRNTYYWLSDVSAPVTARSLNDWSWPTAPVLKQLSLGDVGLDNLGVTVRLGQAQPSKREQILPAQLSDAADAASSVYLFQLKTNGRANVQAAIYSGDELLSRRPAGWEAANSPINVPWDGSLAKEGWYRLVLSGYFANNAPLDKEIVFYHRPGLRQR